jgi:hypothetical protein
LWYIIQLASSFCAFNNRSQVTSAAIAWEAKPTNATAEIALTAAVVVQRVITLSLKILEDYFIYSRMNKIKSSIL